MKIEKTDLEDVLLIKPSTNFEDFRGTYIETYNRESFERNNINLDFIQDDISRSRKNVLRGLHGDYKTTKLVSCIYGSFYLVVVNNKKDHHQYKKHCTFSLSDRNSLQILIPPGFANGHLVMTDEAIFHYKQTTLYDRNSQFTLKWDDPDLDIFWPKQFPVQSKRDT